MRMVESGCYFFGNFFLRNSSLFKVDTGTKLKFNIIFNPYVSPSTLRDRCDAV